MNFKTSFKANNNTEYEIVVPVPFTATDCFISIVKKDSQEEMLRVNAHHLDELLDMAEKAAKLFHCQTVDDFLKKYVQKQ